MTDGSNNILTIEIGGFGLRTGKWLRETMLSEHCIDNDGHFKSDLAEKTATSVYGNNYDWDKFIENADVYFTEEQDGKGKECKLKFSIKTYCFWTNKNNLQLMIS